MIYMAHTWNGHVAVANLDLCVIDCDRLIWSHCGRQWTMEGCVSFSQSRCCGR